MDEFRRVDPVFRQILLELTKDYISQNPPDFLDFALDFFLNKKKERRSQSIAKYKMSVSDEPEEGDDRLYMRRASVHGESFDPEFEEYIPSKSYPKTEIQKNKLKDALSSIIFFEAILDEDRDHLVDAMQEKLVLKDEIVIKEGDVGDYFYIVEKGKFEAYKIVKGEKVVLKTYDDEGFFGELALLHNTPRASSVRALTVGALWSIDRVTFRKIILKAEFNRTEMYDELLQNVPLLESLTPYERRTIADCLIPCAFKPGERLICEGDSADGMFFILGGTARVAVKDKNTGEEVDIKTLTSGDYIGELALITHKPRAASVYAVDNVRAAFLEVESFERLLGPCMDIMQRNIGIYQDELQHMLPR